MVRYAISFSLLIFTVAAVKNGALCDAGKWGYSCEKICGGGCPGSKGIPGSCDRTSGVCLDTVSKDDKKPRSGQKKCEPGWTNEYLEYGEVKCNQPLCFGSLTGCDNNGKCIAPNHCLCGIAAGSTSIVELEGEFPDTKTGDMVQGTNCVNLRQTGLKGFLIACTILILSISTCGGIEVMRNGYNKKTKLR